jgi:hypothetical protein
MMKTSHFITIILLSLKIDKATNGKDVSKLSVILMSIITTLYLRIPTSKQVTATKMTETSENQHIYSRALMHTMRNAIRPRTKIQLYG